MTMNRRQIFKAAALSGSLLFAPHLPAFAAEAKAPKVEGPALVFGHKKPDTDTVIGAMACAYLYQKRGMNVEARVQGKLNPETEFVLKRFGLKCPELVTSVAGRDVYIVDFAEMGQAPDDMKDANLKGIVDHHKLGDVESSAQIEGWIQPMGSANTILKIMFDFYGVAIPKDLAGGMLCAVLSDTVLFKSPTCTPADKKAAAELAKIAGVTDVEALGMEMFKAKSNLNDTPRNLVTRDYKEYDMAGQKICIGQLELVDLGMIDAKLKGELQAEMNAMVKEGRHTVILMLTDIIKKGTEILVASADEPKVLATLNMPKNGAWMQGVMSRKKQIVPPLKGAFK